MTNNVCRRIALVVSQSKAYFRLIQPLVKQFNLCVRPVQTIVAEYLCVAEHVLSVLCSQGITTADAKAPASGAMTSVQAGALLQISAHPFRELRITLLD